MSFPYARQVSMTKAFNEGNCCSSHELTEHIHSMAFVIKCSLQAPRYSHTEMQIRYECRPDKCTDQIAILTALVNATCCSRISN